MANIERIGALAKRFEGLASPAFRQSACDRLAEVSLQQIDDCYKQERDPYGSTWARTKRKNPILQDTGAFRRSWQKTSVRPDGFTVSSPVPYGAYQEYGTSSITPRMTIPMASRGLGQIWLRAYAQMARLLLNEALK